MALQVWKYQCPFGTFKIDIPIPARVIAFDHIKGIPHLWVLVDPNTNRVSKHFLLTGTGHEIQVLNKNLKHIDTCIIREDEAFGHLVWHLFEIERS